MSENNERNIEETLRENAPAEPVAEAKPAVKVKRKKRKNGVALPLVAVLTAVALVFGLVVGYGIGRSTLLEKMNEIQAELDELRLQSEILEAEEAVEYNAFEEALTGANAAALNDLAGETAQNSDNSSALVGEDGLEGEAVENTAVVAEFNGGTITGDELARAYGERMAQLAFEGYDDAAIAGDTLEQVLRELVSQRILDAQAEKLGAKKLSAADQAEIDAKAGAEYALLLEDYRAQVSGVDMTDEEITGAAKLLLQEKEGITLEGLRERIEKDWWQRKVYDAITKDVVADEAAVQAAYDALVAQQQAAFGAYPADFEFAQRSGETIAYRLEGYRAVKVLQFPVDGAALERVAAIESQIAQATGGDTAALQKELDAIYAEPEALAQDALAGLEAGGEFEGAEYYVSEGSEFWPAAVIDAVFGFAQAGDRSGALRTGDGVCILEYVGEVPSGAVPMEEVRAALEEQVLAEAKDGAYQAQLDAWLSEANANYYPERLR